MLNWLKSNDQARCDLIHNHSLWMMPNVYAGIAANKRDLPLIVSPRGTLAPWAFKSGSLTKKLFWPLLQLPAIRATRCFHATSDEEAEHVRAAGFAQPIAVIPNGIDVPKLQTKQRSNRRILLFVGRVHPIKGLDMLVRAWARLCTSHPQWDLRIVGPDDVGYSDELRKLARELNAPRIDFAGPLWGEAKLDAYRSADLFVLPSYTENFGVAAAEALATGTAVVASKGTPWSGLERHGAGWWTEAADQSIAATLDSALSVSRETLDTMGARGRDWMVRDFSWAHVGEMMRQTYTWVIRGGGRPTWVRSD
jgi:glycosyltransferase involved in cell wall biosynthesis